MSDGTRGEKGALTALTPTERHIGELIEALGDRLSAYGIKEFAQAANTSVASVHRFCRKLGLEGFKELKVAVARAEATRARRAGAEDVNFPFDGTSAPGDIAASLESLYAAAVADTRALLSRSDALQRASDLVCGARTLDIYTHSHNRYAALMLRDRMLSIGRDARCPETEELMYRTAVASGAGHVALLVSYSGRVPYYPVLLSALERRGVPAIFMGTPAACDLNPGLACYLPLADREDPRERITQLSSHVAVGYALDVLYGCVCAADYDRNLAFVRDTLPYVDRRPFGGADPLAALRETRGQDTAGERDGGQAAEGPAAEEGARFSAASPGA